MRILIITTIILAIFQYTFGQAEERGLIREGNEYLKEGKYILAEDSYKTALEKKDGLIEGIFNLGDLYYRQDSTTKAIDQFELAAKLAEDDQVKAKAYHNLGNSYLKDKQYKESIKAYKEALKLNPKDMDTKYNLSYASSMLKQQPPEQQQQEKDDEEKGGENEEEKNQENDEKKDDGNKEKKDGPNQQEQESNEQEAEEKKSDEKPKPDDYNENEQGETQPHEAQLSKEEAERLLEALKQEEQKIQERIKKAKMKRDNSKVEKDW